MTSLLQREQKKKLKSKQSVTENSRTSVSQEGLHAIWETKVVHLSACLPAEYTASLGQGAIQSVPQLLTESLESFKLYRIDGKTFI